MRHRKITAKRKTYSVQAYLKKKVSDKQPDFTPQGTRKRREN